MAINRDDVFNKYNSHCAYCGGEITRNKFQVDHIHPKSRAVESHDDPDLDKNRPENLNPSCRKCNKFKDAFKLEEFRKELSLQVPRLLKGNAQFNRALKYGQIKIIDKPIVFYFEHFAPEEGAS